MILIPLPGRLWRITQRFGGNAQKYKRFDLKGHSGVDLAPLIPGTKGMTVYAPHDGFVSIGNEGADGYGRFVSILSDPYGTQLVQRRSDLAHLDSFLVSPNQFVNMGDPIGIMGTTGFSSGIHLHWTFKRVRDGQTLDYNNGYHGAIDISSFALYWSLSHL